MNELFYAVAVKVKAAFRAVQVSVAAGREMCYNFVLETVRAIVAAFAVPHNVNGFIVQSQFSRFKRKLAYSLCLVFLLLFFPCFLFGSETVLTGETVSLSFSCALVAEVIGNGPERNTDGESKEGSEGKAVQAFVREEFSELDKESIHSFQKIFFFIVGLWFGRFLAKQAFRM